MLGGLIRWNSGHALLLGRRFMWWAPWGVTSPLRPQLYLGGDECGNPSACLNLPALGTFIVFYSRVLSSIPLDVSS